MKKGGGLDAEPDPWHSGWCVRCKMVSVEAVRYRPCAGYGEKRCAPISGGDRGGTERNMAEDAAYQERLN